MTKVTLNNLANLQNEATAVSTINNNNDALEAASDNTLSRDGTAPNQMEAVLDMNSNPVINLPAPLSDEEPVRLIDLQNYIINQDAPVYTGTGPIVKQTSPSLLGTPTAPTAAPGTNNTQIATTAFVNTANNFLQAGTGAVTRTMQDKVRDTICVRDYGARGDVVIITGNTSITSGTAALTVTGAAFTSADIGKNIIVPGAGVAGGNLTTTIAGFTSATQVTLTANASTTLSAVSKQLWYGTDDTTAFNSAFTYASAFGGTVYVPADDYMINGTINIGGNGTRLRGDGPINTRLWSILPSNAMIVVGGGLSEVAIDDVQLDRPPYVTASSGANGISWALASISDGKIRRVWCRHHYVGFALGPCALGWLQDIRAEYNISHGVHIVNNTVQQGAQWYTNNVYAGQNGGCGFVLQTTPSAPAGGMGTGNITRLLTFANTSFGFAALGSAASPIHAIRLSDSFMGQDNTDEILLDTYGADHQISNCFIELAGTFASGPTLSTPASNVGSGLNVTANNINIIVNNVISNGNSTHGMSISAGFSTINNSFWTFNVNQGLVIADGTKAILDGNYFTGNAGNLTVSSNASSLVAVGNFPVTVNNDGYREATGSTGAMTNNTGANGATLSLPPGNWDVSGGISYTVSGTTNLTYCEASVSTTSATRNGAAKNCSTHLFASAGTVLSAGDNLNINTPTVRLNLTSTTSVYIVGQAGIVASTLSGNGFIRARWVN